MIYFTEITQAAGVGPENITFQFQMKELPESVKRLTMTKVNKIEYNGGFITNQIIGKYEKEIEWEGCFYGTYTDETGNRISAKERSELIKKFMGRPIRVGFPMPQGSDVFIPGEDYASNNLIGKPDEQLGKRDIGVYIIEEYEQEIINYSDVNYRIKLVPHMRQEKIKPTSTQAIAVKVNTETVAQAAAKVKKAAPKGNGKPTVKKAVTVAKKADAIAAKVNNGKPAVNRQQTTTSRRAQAGG